MGAGNNGELQTFFGESEGTSADNPAKLSQAFEAAAEAAIRAGVVGGGKTEWFRVAFIDVELSNQHPKTVRVGVTKKDPS
jgi:hypothetical protein